MSGPILCPSCSSNTCAKYPGYVMSVDLLLCNVSRIHQVSRVCPGPPYITRITSHRQSQTSNTLTQLGIATSQIGLSSSALWVSSAAMIASSQDCGILNWKIDSINDFLVVLQFAINKILRGNRARR